MFEIISIDTDSMHDGNFVYDFPDGFDSWLLLLIHTKSIFRVNNELVEYPADSLVLFKPFMPIYYKACEDTYSDDWMCFSCSETDFNQFAIEYGVPVHTPLAEHCHNVFKMLHTENFLGNEYRMQTISSLIPVLINKIAESEHLDNTSPKHSNLVDLRREIYKYPGEKWTLTNMANKVFLSESHLQALYKKTFNVSCINDVINARMQLAKSLLIYTDYPISYIASSCGYNNMQHFFRQFNNITGCSPNTYRKTLRP